MMELDHVLVAVDDLDAAATRVEERYGLASVEGGRHQGLGTANRIAADEPSLPFFIEWGTGTPYPGEALSQSATIDELRLQGDPDRIADWAGDTNVPLSVSEGRPALLTAVLDGAVLDPTRWA
jgi:hypothetical protein